MIDQLEPRRLLADVAGLSAQYYDDKALTALMLTRIDAQVNFNWGSSSPSPSIAADTFSARWTGKVLAPRSETFTFITGADDGVRLWVNNQLIINSWIDSALKDRSGTIALTAGQKYDLKMEYYESAGGAAATLSWQSASIARQIIPAANLFHVDSTFSPVRINAGGAAFVDATGQTWQADAYFNGGSATSLSTTIANTTDDALYYTRRTGNFSYAIPIASGTYTLSLLFADTTLTQPNERKFDVQAEGNQILNDFDIIAAGGARSAVVRQFSVTVNDGTLNLNFVNVLNNASLSAIQIADGALVHVDPGFSPLFNGQNLNGFYTYIPSRGINSDPEGYFKIENGMIHVLDLPATSATKDYGYFATTSSYSDYRLRFEYKWGTKIFAPKIGQKRDSGVMFHATGADGIWPNSAELQIQEGDTGDAWLAGNVTATTTVTGAGNNNLQYYKEAGSSFTSTSPYTRIVHSASVDSYSSWNKVELIVSGDSAVYVVNGVVVNRISKLKSNGVALKSGKLLFQAEGAEIYYRNIQIQQMQYPAVPSGATSLFNGTTSSLNNWKKRTDGSAIAWTLVDGALQVKPGSGDIVTKANYTNFTLHVEFKTNVTPGVTVEQNKGNSGIYLLGRYEVQVLDSFGVTPSGTNDLGAIYGIKDPSINAALPAETWQSYDISFTAPTWSGSTKLTNARVTVKLNGYVVQDNVSISTNTLLGDAESPLAGPILLQDHNNAVQYRNIWIKPA